MYPQVSLDISEGGTYKLAEQVINHEVDLAVLSMSDLLPVRWENLTVQPLCRTETVVVASRHHMLAHKENISKVRMVNEISFDYSTDYISRDLLRAVLGLDETNIICSVNNPEALLSFVREGIATMLVPRCVLEVENLETDLRDLCVLDLAPDIQFPLYYACVYLRNRHLPEPVQALIAIIRECLAQIAVHA